MMPDETPHADRRGIVFLSVLLFAAFAALFISLRSKDPMEVDGAFRCLGVFRQQQLYVDGNKHLLYPTNVWVWTRLVSFAGLGITSAQGFFQIVEVMNCVAAAGCLVLLFQLSLMATASTSIAVAVALSFGLTKAFLLSATNASEPMVAVFWSFLAAWLAARSYKTSSRWPAFFSGLLLALAMASYQSTVLLGPVAVLILWSARPPRSPSDSLRPKLASLSIFCAGALIGCLVIYGWVVRLRIQSSPSDVTTASVIHGLFYHSDARAYFGISLGRLLNVPIGFLRNIYPVLPDFYGIRAFLKSSPLSILLVSFLLTAISALVLYCIYRIAGLWPHLQSRTRAASIFGLVGFAFTLFPIIVWEPQYEKFWIQPLACLFFLFGVVVRAVSQFSVRPVRIIWSIPILLIAGLLSNFGWVVRSHANPVPELREADRLAALVRPGDLVIAGWDGVSVLYGYGWVRSDEHYISFPSEAVQFGPEAAIRVQESIRKTLGAGGQVYFLGLLDQSKQSWDSFLARRCGVPYSVFDVYRDHSVQCASFETRSGVLALKKLQFPNPAQ